jgi:Nup133 N terminal like
MNTTVEASALDQARAKLKEFWKDDFVPLQAAGALINSALRADEENADLYHRIFDGNTPGSHLYFPAEPNASMDGSSSSSSSSTSNQTRRDSVNQLAVSPPSATPSTTPSPQPTPTAPPLMRLQHRNSVDLPLVIVKELATTGRFIQMGLLSEASLAWTIVDEKLYVWSYESSSAAAPNGTATSGAVGSIGAASGKQPKSFAVFTTPSREPVGAVGLVRPKPGTLLLCDCQRKDWRSGVVSL